MWTMRDHAVVKPPQVQVMCCSHEWWLTRATSSLVHDTYHTNLRPAWTPYLEKLNGDLYNFLCSIVKILGLVERDRHYHRLWSLFEATKRISELFSFSCFYDELWTDVFQVISIKSDDLILEAFKCMKDNRIGGLPVVEGPNHKIVGSVSIRDIRFLLLKPGLFSNFRY